MSIFFSVLRYGVLLAILGMFSWQFYAHTAVSKVYPSVHGICPFGGLEALTFFIAGDPLPGKIFSGTMALFFATIALALILKRSFCGMLCPLGTMQELLGNLGRLVFGKKLFGKNAKFRLPLVVPGKLDRVLRFLKYGILVLVIVMAWVTGTLWMQSFDPWTAYAHMFNPAELTAYWIGFAVLLASLVLSFVFERFFCKYLCPMGAFLGLVGRFSPFKPRRNAEVCSSCMKCNKVCPVNVSVADCKTVTSMECISCMKCVDVCPDKGALEIRIGKLRISPLAAVAIVVTLFFAVLFSLEFVGMDRYSGRQSPTLREIATQKASSTTQLKQELGLPLNLYDGTRAEVFEKMIPLAAIAGMNGMDAVAFKTMLELPADYLETTAWVTAFGDVKLSVIVRLNNTTLEDFKREFGLTDTVTADTLYKDVREQVESAQLNATGNEGESCGGH